MSNLDSYNFESNIITLIQNSELPLYVIYLILRNIYKEIENLLSIELLKEQGELLNEENKESLEKEFFIPKEVFNNNNNNKEEEDSNE